MLKVLGQDFIAELLGLLDHEAITFFCPSGNVLSQRIVDDLEEFDQERRHVVY